MKKHFNVLIATPGDQLTSGYVKSLLVTTKILTDEGFTWNFLNAGGSLVSMAREQTIAGWQVNDPNMLVPCSGEFTYDKIFWIDSDIEWHPSDFFKLLQSDKDIISGNYLMQNRMIPIFNQPRGEMMPESELLEKTEPFKVVACGFGFICIKNGVFEKMPRPWFGPVAIPNYDEKTGERIQDFILVGEDISWCTKAIDCGFEIWVDPLVKVTHQKNFKINWKEI